MDLWKSLRVIRYRKWTFLLVSLAAFLVAVLIPRNNVVTPPPPTYQSTAKVLITPQNLNTQVSDPGVAPVGPAAPLTAWFADEITFHELLTSEALLSRVAAKLPGQPSWLVLRAQIEVKPLSQRSLAIFTISVTGANAKEAQQATDVLISEFVEYVQELSSKEFAATRRYLEELIAQANVRIQKTQADLERVSAGLPSQEETDQQARQRVELEAQNAALSEQIDGLRNQVSQLNAFISGASKTPPWEILVQKDAALSGLAEDLSKERLALLELEKVYNEDNEQLLTQRKRVADQEALYLKQVAAVVQSLAGDKSRELAEKEGLLAANKSRLEALRSKRVPESARLKVERLKRQLDMHQESYIELVRQLNRARVNELSSRRQGAITVLERPLPGQPTFVFVPPTRSYKQLFLALPLCLLLGAGAALLADYLQASLRLQPRIEAMMDLPILAVIPQLAPEVTQSWDEIKQEAVMKREASTPGGR